MHSNGQPLEKLYMFQHQKIPQLGPIPPISPPEIKNPDFYKIFINDEPYDSILYRDFHDEFISPGEQCSPFVFFFTGGNKDDILSSQKVYIYPHLTPEQCSKELLKIVVEKYPHLKDKQILVYRAGGIPFIEGLLSDLYMNEKVHAKYVIYGILTNKITETILNTSYHELCDISDEQRRLLLSPLCESSDRGLCEIACLLGYLNHGGFCSDILLNNFASITHFPPFVTSLKRIVENDHVVGRDIITVCSTLFTLFRSYVPKNCKDFNVFEYTFKLCGLVSNIDNDVRKLPLINIDEELNLKNDSFSYLSLSDFKAQEGGFNYVKFEVDDEKLNDSSNEKFPFHPINPLSMKTAKGCSIVTGKNHDFLFLMQSPLKDSKSQNKAQIIDPFIGLCETKDIEEFAREQEIELDPKKVSQIIMFDLCESESMLADFDNKASIIACACQCITTFISIVESSHLQNVHGLISFSEYSILRCPLTPLLSEFERKFFKGINSDSKKTKNILDSISFCCDEIIKFKGQSYEKSYLRIIVICDDVEEDNSNVKTVDLIRKLKENKIVVDSIILHSNESNFSKMISVISHVTNGFSFYFDSFEKCLSLFEQDAFINIDQQKARLLPLIPTDKKTISRRLKPDQITEEFISKVFEHSEFDTEIINRASFSARVSTPANVIAKAASCRTTTYKLRRILHELHFASLLSNEESQYFDPDIKIFPHYYSVCYWKVFIKGEDGSPYEKKWWCINLCFPNEYPFKPPSITFSSIPFHLNVSSEGRICLDSIEKDYFISKHVIEILQEIKELFFHPNIESPLSIKMLDLFINDYDKYVELAKKSATDNAKDSYLEYLENEIKDELPPDFVIKEEEKIPQFMISQTSGREIKVRKAVKSSTGIYYNRDDLVQLVCSNKNPTCIVTGKVLTEKASDIEAI